LGVVLKTKREDSPVRNPLKRQPQRKGFHGLMNGNFQEAASAFGDGKQKELGEAEVFVNAGSDPPRAASASTPKESGRGGLGKRNKKKSSKKKKSGALKKGSERKHNVRTV
jgi:hypothetical protein